MTFKAPEFFRIGNPNFTALYLKLSGHLYPLQEFLVLRLSEDLNF